MSIEKVVKKSSLKDFRERPNPWADRSYRERLDAMAVICQTQQNDADAQQGFPRIYKITRA